MPYLADENESHLNLPDREDSDDEVRAFQGCLPPAKYSRYASTFLGLIPHGRLRHGGSDSPESAVAVSGISLSTADFDFACLLG